MNIKRRFLSDMHGHPDVSLYASWANGRFVILDGCVEMNGKKHQYNFGFQWMYLKYYGG